LRYLAWPAVQRQNQTPISLFVCPASVSNACSLTLSVDPEHPVDHERSPWLIIPLVTEGRSTQGLR
jgi:hypothetical protein